MSLVAGEDSESSDEEINTDQLHERPVETAAGGIVTGEDNEEEEETDATQDTSGPAEDPSTALPQARPQWVPPSLYHRKLGEANLSLRKNIVDRILKLYHMTCRNLTVVNDNLSRAQGVIEKVNANVKKSDQDLAQLKASLDDIFDSAHSLAPTLNMVVAETSHAPSE